MLPSFVDLFYFHEVANELHFSRAAKRLNVSQPSLSIAIKRLETLLDASLFIRHKQGMRLTRAGEELLGNVKIILNQWEKTLADIKATTKGIQGVIRIGCHSTLTPFLSGMVSGLYHHYPDIDIHFHHDVSANILEKVVKGYCEIGIVVDPYPHSD